MSRGHRLRAALTAVVLLLLPACAPAAPQEGPEPAPALQGTDLDGRRQDLAEHRGDVVVVSVWASWCGPCREEIPVLARAQERLGPEGLVVLGLNFRDNPDAARDFLEEERPPFASVADPKGAISVGWGVVALPQSFVVDRDGNLVERHFGPVTDDWIEQTVAPEVQG